MDLEILHIAADTKNNREIKNFTHKSKFKSQLCGDEIEISLIIKDQKILDMGYQCKSCIYCQASVSLLSEKSMNKSLIKIKDLLEIAINFFDKEKSLFPEEWQVFKKIFNNKNISRKECLLLPFKALAKALKL